MTPNPLAELRAVHPELGISDPPTKEDWIEFRNNKDWKEKHAAIRKAKAEQIGSFERLWDKERRYG